MTLLRNYSTIQFFWDAALENSSKQFINTFWLWGISIAIVINSPWRVKTAIPNSKLYFSLPQKFPPSSTSIITYKYMPHSFLKCMTYTLHLILSINLQVHKMENIFAQHCCNNSSPIHLIRNLLSYSTRFFRDTHANSFLVNIFIGDRCCVECLYQKEL